MTDSLPVHEEAFMAYVRCPSPTCNDRLTDFRDLQSEAEIEGARQVLLPMLDGGHFVAKAFHRCGTDGCRRVQRKDNWRVGTFLPAGL
ncbi:hypothetical protein [Streptomyces griseus]|uniref:hypothetical protein n=1 Tax=Streptomyces griseus TaxID=1911 RepID=UPI00131A7B95|nr:hypothetical protein [Streptomyces griseus]